MSMNRSWDRELKDVMVKLQEHLEEECDDYLKTKVKQQTLKVGKQWTHPNTP